MKQKKSTINIFSLGSLVTFTREGGLVCYVYEVYGQGTDSCGVSIISQDGRDFGGFTVEEQAKYLKYYGDTGKCYNFKNCTQLGIDFYNGVFDFAFKNAQQHKHKLVDIIKD